MQDRWYQTGAVDSVFNYYSTPREFDDEGIPVRKNGLICLPTGTGKSVVQARFFQRAFAMVPDMRAISATHNKDLIGQNEAKQRSIWPGSPSGIYSAGLKRRDTALPLIFGGVQSIVGKFPMFGYRDFLFVDEAHLIGEEGSYLKLIHEMMYGDIVPHGERVRYEHFVKARENPRCNPFLKIVGMSATPYRLGMGLLTNGGIFTDIIYDLCSFDGFNRLVDEGFIAPLISKPTNTTLDVTGVKIVGQDFNQTQLQAAVDKPDVTYNALCEFVTFMNNPLDYRHCAMIFASGVEHAEHINDMLNNIFGIPSVVMHSKQSDALNDEAMKRWKSGKARVAVSMNKLTTGVDHPPVDLIGMFRPTASTGLWVQMLGRGTRPYDFNNPGDVDPAAFPYIKRNCMVLDFAGNALRLGPINDPIIPKRKGEGPPGDAPLKICKVGSPPCNTHNHTSARFCVVCGTEFPTRENIDANASTAEVMKAEVEMPQIEMVTVDRMIMKPHVTAKGFSAIQIVYYCGRTSYFEQKSMDSISPFFKHRSRQWFRQMFRYEEGPLHLSGARFDYKDGIPEDCPNNNEDVIELQKRGRLRQPKRIQVWLNAKPRAEIQGYEF